MPTKNIPQKSYPLAAKGTILTSSLAGSAYLGYLSSTGQYDSNFIAFGNGFIGGIINGIVLGSPWTPLKQVLNFSLSMAAYTIGYSYGLMSREIGIERIANLQHGLENLVIGVKEIVSNPIIYENAHRIYDIAQSVSEKLSF